MKEVTVTTWLLPPVSHDLMADCPLDANSSTDYSAQMETVSWWWNIIKSQEVKESSKHI